jgi:hypothetical protein
MASELKTPPPLLIGAALVFWGWQSGFLIVGILMGIALESPRWLTTRWDLSDDDFSRIWTFCTLLFLAAGLYAFTSNEGPSNFLGFFQDPNFSSQRHAGNSSARTAASLIRWLPMVFFLFVIAQAFSPRQGVPLETISLILRRRWKKARRLGQPILPSRVVNVGYFYFAMCLVAASVHSSENTRFFWGLCLLLVWALWSYRSPRFNFTIWLATMAVAVSLGYVGQGSLGRFRTYLETFNPQWLSQWARRGSDPARTATALGQVGRLKLSGKIVIRLQVKEGAAAPTLLREATYRHYKSQVWFAGVSKEDFENVNHDGTNDNSWLLLPPKPKSTVINIGCYLDGGKGLLPLPRGSTRLDNLPVFVLQKNSNGAVLATGPGLVLFDATYGPGETIDSPPSDGRDVKNEDFLVPEKEEFALTQVLNGMDVHGLTFAEKLSRVNAFFQSNFTYSTWQAIPEPRGMKQTPLTRFLLRTRSGHCEYFATATTLLLRKLGIPARYAVGYAVHEASGHNFVVRQRDAHAWCLVWNDTTKLWQDFDTTPASWVEAEGREASPFQAVSDAWSRFTFEFSKIRWGQSRVRQYLLWALGPILALLLHQIIFRSRRERRGRKRDPKATAVIWPGLDSEFYQLEKKLAARGLTRQPGEPLSHLLDRAAETPALIPLKTSLEELLRLHYRYRFDPHGLAGTDRENLRRHAKECSANLDRAAR